MFNRKGKTEKEKEFCGKVAPPQDTGKFRRFC